MCFESRFNTASVPCSHLTTLEKDIKYSIRHTHNSLGLSSLISLRHPANGTLVKVFVPKRYTTVFEEKYLSEINQRTVTYQLVSEGIGRT
jgi:hypothetical protein